MALEALAHLEHLEKFNRALRRQRIFRDRNDPFDVDEIRLYHVTCILLTLRFYATGEFQLTIGDTLNMHCLSFS